MSDAGPVQFYTHPSRLGWYMVQIGDTRWWVPIRRGGWPAREPYQGVGWHLQPANIDGPGEATRLGIEGAQP